MLKKLLKYDLIWIDRFLAFYAIAPLIALALERFTNAMVNTHGERLWTILDRIAVNVLISVVASLVITAFARSIGRFVQTVYKDASYLTHTLPVKRGTVFTEKFLAGLISMAGAMAVSGLCLLIAAIPKNAWPEVWHLLRRGDVWLFIFLMAFCALMELAFALLVTMFGYVVGQRAVKGKATRSVLLSVVLYLSIQAVLLAGVYALLQIVPTLNDYFLRNTTGFSTEQSFFPLNLLFAISGGIYFAVNALLFVFGRRRFCKGVDVE